MDRELPPTALDPDLAKARTRALRFNARREAIAAAESRLASATTEKQRLAAAIALLNASQRSPRKPASRSGASRLSSFSPRGGEKSLRAKPEGDEGLSTLDSPFATRDSRSSSFSPRGGEKSLRAKPEGDEGFSTLDSQLATRDSRSSSTHLHSPRASRLAHDPMPHRHTHRRGHVAQPLRNHTRARDRPGLT